PINAPSVRVRDLIRLTAENATPRVKQRREYGNDGPDKELAPAPLHMLAGHERDPDSGDDQHAPDNLREAQPGPQPQPFDQRRKGGAQATNEERSQPGA